MAEFLNVLHLYRAPGHNYLDHHGRQPDVFEVEEVEQLECVAGQGIRGDRFFNHKENFKGQITFFANEVFIRLCQEWAVDDKRPSAFRRNVITQGADLNQLIGKAFEIQGIRFEGVEECRPCYWMNQAFHPQAEEMLKGNGGLRARILSDGFLKQSEP